MEEPNASDLQPLPPLKGRILACLIAGLVASLAWCIADILLVGFPITPERYPLLSQTYGERLDPELATLMVEASTQRLSWGVYVATFSTWAYLVSIYATLRSIRPQKSARWLAVLMVLCYSIYPPGHAGFFYIGETSKQILAAAPACQAGLVELAVIFQDILTTHWLSAIGLSAAVWTIYGVLTLMSLTALPRHLALINPVPIAFLLLAAKSWLFPAPISDWVGASIFNLAHLIFFGLLYLCWRQTTAKTATNTP